MMILELRGGPEQYFKIIINDSLLSIKKINNLYFNSLVNIFEFIIVAYSFIFFVK